MLADVDEDDKDGAGSSRRAWRQALYYICFFSKIGAMEYFGEDRAMWSRYHESWIYGQEQKYHKC